MVPLILMELTSAPPTQIQRLGGLLSRLLRGELTSPHALAMGQLQALVRPLVLASIGLAVLYGGLMGSFALFSSEDRLLSGDAWLQVLSSAIKLPFLFFGALLITLPSLLVITSLMRLRLPLRALIALTFAMNGVALCLAASVAPITAFFGLTSGGGYEGYTLTKALHIVALTISGLLGWGFFVRSARASVQSSEKVTEDREISEPVLIDGGATLESEQVECGAEEGSAQGSTQASPLDHEGLAEHAASSTTRRVLYAWSLLYTVVVLQLGWQLRPFVGNPRLEFEWFRAQGGNFFQDAFQTLLRAVS